MTRKQRECLKTLYRLISEGYLQESEAVDLMYTVSAPLREYIQVPVVPEVVPEGVPEEKSEETTENKQTIVRGFGYHNEQNETE